MCVCVCVCVCVHTPSHVQLFVTPWTVAHQAPLSTGLSRQECWSGVPSPSPGDRPHPGIEPSPLHLLHRQAGSLALAPPGNSIRTRRHTTWNLGREKTHRSTHCNQVGKIETSNLTISCSDVRTFSQRSLITTHFHYSNSPRLAVGRQKRTAPTEIPQPCPETSIS